MERASGSRVPQFTGDNFDDWKFLMSNALRDEGCLDVTQASVGELIYAVGLDAPGDNAATRKRKQEEIKSLELKENRCRRLLGEGLLAYLELLKDKPNAFRMWEAVCERFGRTSLSSKAVLSKEYYGLRYKPSEATFAEYCLKYDKVVRGLRNAGSVLSEEDVAFHFLWSLPSEYEAQTSAIATNPSNVNLQFIRSWIEEYELRTGANKRKKGGSSSTTSFNALSVSGRGRGREATHPYKGCHNCGKQGHKIASCYKRGGGAYRGGHTQNLSRSNYQQSNQSGSGNSGNSTGNEGGSQGQGGNQGSFQPRGRGFTPRGYQRGRGGFRGGRGRGRGGQADSAMVSSQQGYSFVSSEDNEVIDSMRIECLLSHDVPASDAALAVYGNSCVTFTLDSGATRHLVKADVSVSYKVLLQRPVKIMVAKSEVCLMARYKGLVVGYTVVNDVAHEVRLEVLIVDELTHNLLSIPCLNSERYWTHFGEDQCIIDFEGEVLAVGYLQYHLFVLEIGLTNEPEMSMMTAEESLWHKRLGHLGYDNMKRLCNMVNGVEPLQCQGNRFCEVCIEGKQARLPFGGTRPKTTRPLERVHSDLCGPVSPVAYNGVTYVMTIIDDYTHYAVVYGLKSKESEEVLECIKAYVARVSVLFPRGISKFRCDNGGEYVNHELQAFFREKGIAFELTIPGTPQLNGVAERLNRTLFEKSRCLLFGSCLSKKFWFDAMLTAVYLLNRSPSSAVDGAVVPYELWTGNKPNLETLKVFGCVAYVSKSRQQLAGKLDSRVKKCIFIGYCDNGYRFWSVADNKIIVGRNVRFNENANNFDNTVVVYGGNYRGGDVLEVDDEEEEQNEEEEMEMAEDQPQDQHQGEPELEEFDEPLGVGQGARRGTRVRMRPAHFQDYVMLATVGNFVDSITDENNNSNDVLEFAGLSESLESVDDSVPQNFESIELRSDKSVWLAAVGEELNSLAENGTWDVTSLPKGKTPINSKWVFTVKLDGAGNVDRYKARLVIKGCSQRYGVDYTETYAPVAKLATVRIFLCLANKFNLFVQQLDVKCAFLNGDLKEEIYMWPPAGLSVESGKVCKLKKTLYGLKQAPMEWNKKFDDMVKKLGFRQNEADRCLYMRKCKFGVVYLLLYVDDFLIACDNLELLNEIKTKLMAAFQMRDLGEVSYFLGISVKKVGTDGMFLGQENYLTKMLQRFKKDTARPVTTPMETQPDLEIGDQPSILNVHPYRSAIGSLMYSCMSTRPDFCTSVNIFSQFQAYATDKHWKGIKRIMRYILGTVHWGLWFRGNSEIPLVLYADAAFANDPDRKSVSGFIIELFGDPVVWGTRKQTCVAKSSTEAEYIALATAVSELLWVRQLLKGLDISVDNAIPVYEDNQSVIHALSRWDVKRLKHVDVKYNFIKDLYQKKIIDVTYIPSADQKADIMTKGLPYDSFSRHRTNLGMCEIRPK